MTEDDGTQAVSAETMRLMEAQLGRMRGLQYHYYDQFFRFLNIHVVTLILTVIAALAFNERAVLLVPFHAVFLGFHAAYLFSYVTLARTYATALEQRLNRELGTDVLVAILEAVYVFPISARRFVAWSPVNSTSFLSAETVMFTLGLGLIVVVTGIWGLRVAWDVNALWGVVFAGLVVFWTIGCMGFVWWYHFRSEYERRLRQILEARYGIQFVTDGGNAL